MIREKLNVKKWKFKRKNRFHYYDDVNLKKQKDTKEKEFINNSFKCPIIYKNFDEDIIPKNKILLIEIKSGFDILGVKDQININLINDCFFYTRRKTYIFYWLN